MNGTEVALIALVAAGLIAVMVPYVFRSPGRALRKRFIALGTLKGRTRRDIVKAVGEPATETTLPDGRTLLQWRATGYHIALVFEKNGRCFGVTHENGRRVQARPVKAGRGSAPAPGHDGAADHHLGTCGRGRLAPAQVLISRPPCETERTERTVRRMRRLARVENEVPT